MELKYSCPKCAALLNPGSSIILVGKKGNNRYLIALNPEPGNYEISIPEDSDVITGELWKFSCPICRGSLTMNEEKNFAYLDMTDGVGNLHKVAFSRVAGEQATYVINMNPESNIKEYGSNLSKYENCLWEQFD